MPIQVNPSTCEPTSEAVIQNISSTSRRQQWLSSDDKRRWDAMALHLLHASNPSHREREHQAFEVSTWLSEIGSKLHNPFGTNSDGLKTVEQKSKKWTVTVSFHLFFVVWRKRTVLTISIGELMSYISLHLLYHSGLSLIKRLTTQSPKVSLCHCSWPEFFEGDCCRSFDVNWSNNLIKLFLMKISEDQPKQDLLQEEDAEGALWCHFRRASRSYELPSLKGVADEIQGTFTKPYLFFLLRRLA